MPPAATEEAPEPWNPNADLEDMLARMFAPRAPI
jgi:hypothetical protein